MLKIRDKIDIKEVLRIAKKAGETILEVYNSRFSVEAKSDKSPITLADKKSNEIICGGLNRLYPDIPILSEENKDIPYEVRKNWKYFWLIRTKMITGSVINTAAADMGPKSSASSTRKLYTSTGSVFDL